MKLILLGLLGGVCYNPASQGFLDVLLCVAVSKGVTGAGFYSCLPTRTKKKMLPIVIFTLRMGLSVCVFAHVYLEHTLDNRSEVVSVLLQVCLCIYYPCGLCTCLHLSLYALMCAFK